ncbi:MAG: hypothetical protein LCH46_13630 [Proteobacteria bacterium]|nr:hypothetical protein [Pseudomonadota bacterium]
MRKDDTPHTPNIDAINALLETLCLRQATRRRQVIAMHEQMWLFSDDGVPQSNEDISSQSITQSAQAAHYEEELRYVKLKGDPRLNTSIYIRMNKIVSGTLDKMVTSPPSHDHRRPTADWLNYFVPGRNAQEAILALDDLYETFWLPKYGPTRAKFIYRIQSAMIVVSVWWSPVVKLFRALLSTA